MDSIEWHIHCAQLRGERDRFQAYVHALQPILDPSALGKGADGYRDSALAFRDRAEAAEAKLAETEAALRQASKMHGNALAKRGMLPLAALRAQQQYEDQLDPMKILTALHAAERERDEARKSGYKAEAEGLPCRPS